MLQATEKNLGVTFSDKTSNRVGKTKIKIIHLVSDLSIGGAQKVVLDICSSADLDKYELCIFSLGDSTELLTKYALDSRIKVRTFSHKFDDDYSIWGYAKRALKPSTSLAQFRSVIEAAVAEKPDILHLHLGPRELNLGVLIQQRTGCELIYTQHLVHLPTQSLGSAIMGRIFRLTYRKFNLLAVSTTVEAEIRRHKLLGPGKRLRLTENKLNLNQFPPVNRKPGDVIRVIYVARIAPVKGHDDLLGAWSMISGESVPKRLVFVGPDSMDGKMEILAEELGVADTVEWVGPSDRVLEILVDADIAVFPSHQEGLPIALLEKMAMQLPVIVSDIPELTAIVKDGENGLVFKCGDKADLARKIMKLIDGPELRRVLGERARETIEKNFASSNIARPNELVYEEIMS